jgi:hypothetical protein
VALDLRDSEGDKRVLARRVVLATGLDGLGAPVLPSVAHRVPSRFVHHGADLIDVGREFGRRRVRSALHRQLSIADLREVFSSLEKRRQSAGFLRARIRWRRKIGFFKP